MTDKNKDALGAERIKKIQIDKVCEMALDEEACDSYRIRNINRQECTVPNPSELERVKQEFSHNTEMDDAFSALPEEYSEVENYRDFWEDYEEDMKERENTLMERVKDPLPIASLKYVNKTGNITVQYEDFRKGIFPSEEVWIGMGSDIINVPIQEVDFLIQALENIKELTR